MAGDDVPNWISILSLGSAIGSAVVGGVPFAFSTFLMKALDQLPPAAGVSAMQSINKAAPNPWFMTAMFGTALACAVVAIEAVRDWDGPGSAYRLAGACLYLAAVVLTIVYHVPRNDALASVDPAMAGAARHWASCISGWTAGNHVRTLASIAGAAGLALGARTG